MPQNMSKGCLKNSKPHWKPWHDLKKNQLFHVRKKHGSKILFHSVKIYQHSATIVSLIIFRLNLNFT